MPKMTAAATPRNLAPLTANTVDLCVPADLTVPTLNESSTQIDGLAAEGFIAEKRIGERIKHLRLKKSMGLVELGRHTGLSASFLSQLETGRVIPTLRNLARISMVFSKDLSYFFEPEPQTLFRVHRAKDRVRLPQSGVEDPAYFFESLGYLVPDRQLDPYAVEFLPAKPGREPMAHQHVGCEFLMLLTGQLDIQHGEVTHHLSAGDAVYFDAGTTHSYLCSGPASANALIVTLQQNSAQQSNGSRAGVPLGVSSARVRALSQSSLRPRQSASPSGPSAALRTRKQGSGETIV